MSGFAKAMAAFSAESGLETVHDQQNANPDHLPVVTDDTQSELEACVNEIAEDVAKLAENDQLAEKLVETVESMEGRIAQLQAMRNSGVNLDGNAARQFVLGVAESMEARGFPVEFFKGELDKLNTSMESSAYDYSVEAEEAATGIKDRAIAVLKNVYNAVVEFLRKIVDRFRGVGDNLGKAGDRVQKLAIDLEGKAVPEARLKGDSYSELFLNSGGFNPKGAMQQSFDAIDKAYDEASSRIAALTKKLSTGSGELPGDLSIPLSGGVALVIEGKGSAKLKAGSEVKGKAQEVSVATVGVLKDIGKSLSDLSVVLHGIDADNKKVIKSLDEAVKAAQTALEKKDSGADKDSGKVNLSEVSAQMKSVQSLVPMAVKHASNTARIAYRYALASAARYEK